MALDGSVDQREEPPVANANGGNSNGNGNGVIAPSRSPYQNQNQRLKLNPNTEHKPESYKGMELEFNHSLYSSLERYLPTVKLNASREEKVQFMKGILSRYLTQTERARVQRHKEYRQKILSSYTPLHRELHTVQPDTFFVSSFINAISENTKESLRSIVCEPLPGVYTFQMLQPGFCELLLAEVENFEKWVQEVKFRIMRPNTMNKYGAVLDDFGLETMLDKLMDDFIRPISKVFFNEVGGSTLDSHHGFVVEYGQEWDSALGFHVDDSEVTLNVCLGKQFSGGELFFRGIRCDNHVNTETQPEEVLDYSHVPGQAVLHRGRHRHGVKPTTSGHRINLLLWCRSSIFRELKKYQREYPDWCGECAREKRERQRLTVAASKAELLKKNENA